VIPFGSALQGVEEERHENRPAIPKERERVRTETRFEYAPEQKVGGGIWPSIAWPSRLYIGQRVREGGDYKYATGEEGD
jgi:hypothetical protein